MQVDVWVGLYKSTQVDLCLIGTIDLLSRLASTVILSSDVINNPQWPSFVIIALGDSRHAKFPKTKLQTKVPDYRGKYPYF